MMIFISDRMRHRFVSFAAPKSEHCRVCNKTFSGALKQAMKCGGKGIGVRREGGRTRRDGREGEREEE